jgi:D-galacturonate reductase
MSVEAPDVLMIGTGEYTTGFVGGAASKSDKGAGVVALTCIDLRKQGRVGALHMAGVNGSKFPGIRAHMARNIGEAYPASEYDLSFTSYPADGETDPRAYERALDSLPKGSAVIIFTPDDTHYDIALAAVRRGMHVLVTKPCVKTLEHHTALVSAAEEAGVLVAVEVHKRWDPIYTDARDRIQAYGDFSYINAYMSQPKSQLSTFKAWAGKSSDISYYLNSHHIDFQEWCVGESARPECVTALVATGVASEALGVDTEDTITLSTQWVNLSSGSKGIACYTSSWIAPRSDVHSQQCFFYMSHTGEVRVDQAHRGYSVATDASGFASCNPLFMKYTPADGKFVGQSGYGYRSIEQFVAAVGDIRSGRRSVDDCDASLATMRTTFRTTAILEAGRISADAGGSPVRICYDDPAHPTRPTRLVLATAE